MSNTIISVLLGIKEKLKQLLATLFFNLIVLYVLMWVAFQHFSQLFKKPVIDFKTGVPLGDESFCNSSVQCSMVYWSKGLFSQGTDDLIDMVSFKNTPGPFVGLFFYNFVSFVLINTIFGNIFTGCITDAFGDYREKTEKKIYSRKNKCYICDLDREVATEKVINFKVHIKVHNFEKYILFLIYLFKKEYNDHTLYERTIYKQVLKGDITWLPNANEENDDEDQ